MLFSVLILLLILLFGLLALERFDAASRAELRQTEAVLRENLSRKGQALVQTLALSVEGALAENNFGFLHTVIRTASQADPDVAYAVIEDPARKVLVSTPAVAPGRQLLEVSAPIGSEGDRLGTFRLGMDLGALEERLGLARARQRQQLEAAIPVFIGATVGFVVLGLLSALAISTRITKPLAQLTRRAEAIGAGDLDAAVTGQGHDEVGILATTLEGMRRAVKSEIADLRALHDVGKTLGGSLVRDEVAAAALGALRSRVQASSAALYLARDDKLRRLSVEPYEDEDRWPEIGPAEGAQVVPLAVGTRKLGAMATLGSAADESAAQFIDTLAGQVAQSLENIRLYEATAEQARLDIELRTAQAVQRALIPAAPPEVPGLEIAAAYLPAAEVGGDWYGFLPGAGGELHVLIGDVTGHGVPAALLTACATTTCQMMAGDRDLSPMRLVQRLAGSIRTVGKGELMMTFFAARIDAARREVVYSNAGHPAPYHLHPGRTGGPRLGVLSTGPTWILGSRDEPRGGERRAPLEPGETLVFYTDGLIECESPAREPFGTQTLHKLLRQEVGNAESLRDRIMSSALTHYGGQPRVDDITLVVIRVTA